MEVKVNQISDSRQEVEVTLTYSEIQPEIQEAYKEESKSIQIDGFRKGKAPAAMIKKLYGDAIEYKASEKISTKKFWDVVDSNNLKPISTPALIDLNFEPGEKLFFKVQFDIKPKLDLKGYKKLEIEKPIFKVKEEDVEKELDYMQKPHRKYEECEVVEDKNARITVNLDKLDESGNVLPNTKSENMQIDLSDEKVNPQIIEKSIGKKLGETYDFSFVDEHYHGDHLHKEEYKYLIEIKKIEKFSNAEISEADIKKMSGDKATTIDELRAFLRSNFEDYYKRQSDEIFTNSLLNEIVKNNEFTPSAEYVDTIHKRLIEIEKENAKRYKVKDFKETDVVEYLKPKAEWNAKWQVVLENIAEKENLVVEDSELEILAKEEAEKTGIPVAKLVKYYKDTNRTEALLEEKVIKFLNENNIAKEVDAEEKLKEQKDHNHES